MGADPHYGGGAMPDERRPKMPENMKELRVHESSDQKRKKTQEKVRELPEISNILAEVCALWAEG